METKELKRRPAAAQKPAASGRAGSSGRKAAPDRQSARTRRSRRVQRQEETKRTPVRRSRTAVADQPGPEVVYTPAKPFSRSRLLLQLATVLAVVLALTLGLSVFFKVKTVTVSGAEKYSAWAVKEASGIEEGDNLLSFGSIKACGRIIAALPYVESVRIGIKLPDTVNIEIKELDVVYSKRDSSGLWWLMTAEGKVIDQVDADTAASNTSVVGVKLDMPSVGTEAVAAEDSNKSTAPPAEDGETQATVPVTVTAGDRLNTALEILQYLEENGIIGQITTINVEDIGNLRMSYNGDQYDIRLGDTNRLSYKIELMYQAIKSLKEYDTGLLDVSFDLMEDKVIYEPGDTQ